MGMEPFVLDPLPFDISTEWLAEKLHLGRRASSRGQAPPRAQTGLADELAGIVEQAMEIARPKAIYRLAFVEDRGPDWVVVDGARFSSRVVSVNLEQTERVIAYVCTAGRELEDWGWAQPDILHQYYVTAISEAVLYSARQAFGAHLQERWAIEHASEMNPGSLADWPLREQRPLFGLLGDTDAAIGVELMESYLMRPTKSVSGLLFTTADSYVNCRLCPRDVCPNRRAEYDPGLYDSKYGEKPL